ncbi:RICIN domain-containing protein [Streptomyces sp. 7R007]
MTAAHSGKNAQVESASSADAADVVQNAPADDPNQLWQAVAQQDGSFSLVNINSGKCMDVRGASASAGEPVIQWPCSGRPNQRWTFNGSAITSVNSGLCLDVYGGSSGDDAPLIQWPCGTGKNQQWSLTERPRVGAFAPAVTAGGDSFSEQALRMVVHTSAAGSGVRIRVSNLRSTTALSVGAVDVAVRSGGAAAVPGTHHSVTFGGVGNPTVGAGAELTSDVLPMSVQLGRTSWRASTCPARPAPPPSTGTPTRPRTSRQPAPATTRARTPPPTSPPPCGVGTTCPASTSSRPPSPPEPW